MRFLQILCAACAIFKVNCSTIDRSPTRIESVSLRPVPSGVLAETAASAKAALGVDESAFHLIIEAEEALQWRLALVDHARQSIDVQYYLWNIDEAGLLLLSRLLDAADRGVRVRMLIDDLLFPGEEHRLAALCHHPNVEIRIYNPQFVRGSGLASKLEVLSRFSELNRRMHNKAFLVDGQMAIMGGRNIGNEYFGLKQAYNFVDLDVMTTGPVVPEVAASFDRYWNHELSHPGEAFSPETGPEETATVIAGVHQYVREEKKILPASPYPKIRKDWS
ncbi:MAG: phospholipase D-like domain-containing protein, partial [Verrucomicrobiota bacterium]